MLVKINKFVHALALSAIMFGAAHQNAYAGSLSISNVPLFLGNSVQPNVFFLLDDSGSMDWEILTSRHWNYLSYDPNPFRPASTTYDSFDYGFGIDTDGLPNITGNNWFASWWFLYANQDNAYGNNCSGGLTVESCNFNNRHPATLDWRIRSSGHNITFYNPSVTYKPWNGSCAGTAAGATCADATFTNARSNPKSGTVGYSRFRDLSTDGDTQNGPFVYDVWIDDSGYTGARPQRGDNFNDTGVAAGAAAAPNGMVDLWDTHFRFTVEASQITADHIAYDPHTTAEGSRGLNETVEVTATLSNVVVCYDVLGANSTVSSIVTAVAAESNPAQKAVLITAVNGPGCRTIAQAQTNIANWYQYSRRRMFVAKSAVTAVIDAQPKFRYGVTKFKGQGTLFTEVPIVSVTDTSLHNETLKHDMYRNKQEGIGTFLLGGMDSVGEYFRNNLGGKLDPIQHSCQKNFEIIFTDGYWNDSSNKYGDVDGDGHDNAGADIAYFYFKNDLSPLDDNVSPDAGSEADLDPDGDGKTWQHLVAFTVAFGVAGNMADVDGDGWPDKDVTNTDWTTPGTPDKNGDWGNPVNTNAAIPDKIDDLWHIAWNTNGTYAAATSPEEVVEKLLNAIINIAGRVGSASAVALNSGTLNANTRIYQAKFNSIDWSGDLQSIPVKAPVEIDPITLLPVPDPPECANKTVGEVCLQEWSASEKLESVVYTARKVFSRNTDTNTAVIFKTLADLGVSQQTALMTNPDTSIVEAASRGQDRLDWVLGKDSFPAPDDFRKRPGTSTGDVKKLGDIIGSSPTFVGVPNALIPDNLEAASYNLFVAANENRRKMVYVGANDGMLHAFSGEKKSAGGGTEIFAYIPGVLVNKLNQLTSTNYKKKHAYFIDGSPQAFDIYSGGWKTVLASSAGVGGQFVFGLDITNPDAFGASKALWEFTDASDSDMGYVTGNVKFARMSNGQWVVIFGNGFNNTEADTNVSATGNAAIYIVDAFTGALVKKFDTKIGTADDPSGASRPNGIAEVTPVDIDGDLDVDFLYAGDLFGNLWKIDVTSSAVGSWDFAYKTGADPKAFYIAKDISGNIQSITTGVAVKKHPEKGAETLVLFGTGQYFEVGDNQVAATSQVQSFYSIWDDGIAASAAPYDRSNLLENKLLRRLILMVPCLF